MRAIIQTLHQSFVVKMKNGGSLQHAQHRHEGCVLCVRRSLPRTCDRSTPNSDDAIEIIKHDYAKASSAEPHTILEESRAVNKKFAR